MLGLFFDIGHKVFSADLFEPLGNLAGIIPDLRFDDSGFLELGNDLFRSRAKSEVANGFKHGGLVGARRIPFRHLDPKVVFELGEASKRVDESRVAGFKVGPAALSRVGGGGHFGLSVSVCPRSLVV